MKTPRSRRTAGALILGLGLVIGPLSALQAHAAINTCRSDPIITLNNGKTLQLTATISDTQADVTKILYYVQVPGGVAINKITYTAGWKSGIEQVQQQASQPANTYVITTTATTNTSGMAVSATDSLLLNNTTLASGTASGTSTSSPGSVSAKSPVITLKG